MTAQRRMESLIIEEEEAGSSSSGKEDKVCIYHILFFIFLNVVCFF